MKFEYFIAKRILGSKGTNQLNNNLIFTKPIINIATLAIALSACVIIVSVAVLVGFQKQIRNKVSGFGGHIIISPFNDNQSLENVPFSSNEVNKKEILQIKGVRSLHSFATKAGIVKQNDNIEGIVIKGVDTDYNWNFFKSHLIEGNVPTITDTGKSNDVLISKQLADLLNFKIGDAFYVYFIQQPPRARKLKVCGIYKTGLEDYDKLFAIADIKHIIKLNDWKDNEIGGMEIVVERFEDIDFIAAQVQSVLPYNLYAQSIREKEPQIFDWLKLQDINVQIILVLMSLVAGINMITALLVLILENIPLIGILKAMGSTNLSIRKIFSFQAYRIIGRGLIYGNLLGIGLCVLQYYFKLVKLDETSYYVSYVPVELNWMYFVLVNFLVIVICFFMLVVPASVISKITPVKAIKFN